MSYGKNDNNKIYMKHQGKKDNGKRDEKHNNIRF